VEIERLSQSPVGQLVPIKGHDARHGDFAYFAFLPRPLPEDVTLSSTAWTAVSEAAAGLAKLDQACRNLPHPSLLIRPSLWSEALATSALEGTVGALQDLLEARLPGAGFLSPETAEIQAYERVALEAFSLVRERPISMSLLAELQAELFSQSQNHPRDLGQVREDIVWIGEQGRPIEESRFVPAPPGDRLRAGLDLWQDWVRAEHAHLPPVLRAALTHYQFETLHPFNDGNGRVGRLIIVLQLLVAGAIREPAITLSPWFLQRRERYQGELLSVSLTGRWDSWVEFFCRAVCEQCESLIEGADALDKWLNDSRGRAQEKRWTGTIFHLLDGLLEWPVTTVADTADRYGLTTVGATRLINHLVEIDVLRELTGRSYGRVFGAWRIMQIVDDI
jgi:Fic family protein